MAQGKILPHSLEAEQSVLACVMLDNDSCIGGFSRLTEADFYSPSHKIIFTAMRGVIDKNKPVDFVTVIEALSASGKLESVGGLDYLNAINDAVPSSAHFRHYLDILKKNRVLRRLNASGVQIIEASFSSTDEQAALRAAEKAIFDISREDEKKELTAISHVLPEVLDRLDTIQKDPTSVHGLRTGFYGIDDLTNGLQKGELIILAARPSVGKTSLGLNIVLNAAVRGKAKAAVFSLEMSKQSLVTRAVCSLACVSNKKAHKGELDASEWQRLWLANEELSKASIYIDDNSIITPAEIMRKCMRLKREHGLDFVMVDYLGLVRGTNDKYDSRQQEVAENSRLLKILAKELDVPVLLLSQLNRGIEARKGLDSRPVLSDLRDSGAIEQDADVVMFIHKEKASEESDNEDESVDVIIAKHRNGPCGTVKLRWRGDWTTFINMPSEQAAQDARERAAKVKGDMPKKPAQPAAQPKTKPEILPQF